MRVSGQKKDVWEPVSIGVLLAFAMSLEPAGGRRNAPRSEFGLAVCLWYEQDGG